MYLKLMRVFFKENFSFKRIFGFRLKSSKLKTILISFAIIYGFGGMLLGFGYMFFELGRVLALNQMEDLLLNFVFTYATFMSMFFVLLQANGYIFHYRDFNILQPLPIKNRTVIAAKITVMLITIYLTIFIITAPIVFSYFYHGGFNFISLLVYIILMLFIPFVPLTIFSGLSLLIANFSNRFRIGKALNLIFMFCLFLGIMVFSFSMNMNETNPLFNQLDFMDSFGGLIPTGKWFILSIHNLNILAFAGFVGISLAVLFGFIIVVERIVVKTNQSNQNIRVRKNQTQAVSRQKSVVRNIFNKEVKKFFNTTIYIFNCGFGTIMMLIGGVAILIFKESLITSLEIFESANLDLEVLLLVILGFLISTVYTPAISLSLEGKNFWILKSLPIKAETVMLSKMLFNLVLTIPFALFALFMSSIAFGFSALNVVLMILFIISFASTFSILGSVINLHFPKFEYINETEVVKQSIGALLGLFSGFFLLTIHGVIYYFLSASLNLALVLVIAVTINILIFFGLYMYIKKQSESIFMKL
jgi:ABC-2 type transport system permease protein